MFKHIFVIMSLNVNIKNAIKIYLDRIFTNLRKCHFLHSLRRRY